LSIVKANPSIFSHSPDVQNGDSYSSHEELAIKLVFSSFFFGKSKFGQCGSPSNSTKFGAEWGVVAKKTQIYCKLIFVLVQKQCLSF